MKKLEIIKSLIFSCDIYKGLALSQLLIKDINNSGCNSINITDVETVLTNKTFALLEIFFITEHSTFHRPNTDDVLFVISEGYTTGGHTRLMENLSLMLSGNASLLVTRPTNEQVTDKFDQYFSHITTCFNKNDALIHIQQLASHMQGYKKIILNTHPDDIHTIIACALVKHTNPHLKIYFVNHADHLASYGVTVADTWFELSLYGQQLDKTRGLLPHTRISFLGIPIKKDRNEFFRPIYYNYHEEGTQFLTAATAHKYDSVNGKSIEPLIKRILCLHKHNQITLVGSKIDNNPIFLSLKKQYPKRLRFFSSLPHDEYLSLTQNTDFYIDSHPMPGGTAFVEQFINGKPCIGLRTHFYGYTPLELIKRDTIDEVIELLTHSPPTSDFIHSIQEKIFEVHGFENVKHRFLSALYEDIYAKNPMSQYIQKSFIQKNNHWTVSSATLKKILIIDKKLFFKLLLLKFSDRF